MNELEQIIDERRRNRGSRGSANNKGRLAAFAKKDGSGTADWGAMDCALMQAVIVGITQLGGAIIFSLSRDGGAHSITLLLDKSKEVLWFNGDADLNVEMQRVLVTLEDME